MSFYRSIILITVMLFAVLCSRAQEAGHVYKDSAIVNAGATEIETGKKTEEVEIDSNKISEEDEYISDTLLINNQLHVEPDSVNALKNLQAFGYAKNLDSLLYKYRQNLEKEESSKTKEIPWLLRIFLSPITKYFFWILAGVFVSFILYQLFFTEGFFQRSYAKTNNTIVPGEKSDLVITGDYVKLIADAVSGRNYRLAVRFHYLQTLQKLSAKSAIMFAADKTNYQYVRELSGKSYQNAFASLTLNYEYVWYGEFDIDDIVFNTIQQKFKQFNSGV